MHDESANTPVCLKQHIDSLAMSHSSHLVQYDKYPHSFKRDPGPVIIINEDTKTDY